MSGTKTSSSGGVGLSGALFLLFLGLKLAGIGAVASWSWWWVTAPLWLPLAVLLAVAAICFTVAGILSAVGK